MPFANYVSLTFSSVCVQKNAPASSGVYGLSNAKGWVLVGETGNIQAALLAHLREPPATLEKSRPTGFTFELCAAGNRVARQDRLILELEPIGNLHRRLRETGSEETKNESIPDWRNRLHRNRNR